MSTPLGDLIPNFIGVWKKDKNLRLGNELLDFVTRLL